MTSLQESDGSEEEAGDTAGGTELDDGGVGLGGRRGCGRG